MTMPSQSQYAEDLVQRLILPIYASKGWMRLLAVLSFIYAGMTILFTLGFGIIIAWLPIWIGVLLWQGSTAAQMAYVQGTEADAVEALGKIKTIFTIYGVLALVGLALMALYVVLIIVVLSAGDFDLSLGF